MSKNLVWFLVVVVVGALLGAFIGKFIAIIIPAGSIKDLFTTGISAGLSPATLNLQILELTFGCMFKLNIAAVVGVIVSALIFVKIGSK